MIGLVVFITALIAQIWIWDIFGHMKMVKSLSSNSGVNYTTGQNFSTATSNCSHIDKCECKKRNISNVDMSFVTGDLARKHVEDRFSKCH